MEFKPEYVRIMWSEEMEGNRCFVSDRISDLKRIVEEGLLDSYGRVEPTDSRDFPFRSNGSLWRFAYFDPYFTLKQAREEGKTLERFWKSENEWKEWIDDEFPGDLALYRIMPEEETPVTNKELALWLAQGNGQIYHHDDSGFRTEVKTFYIYPQDKDNCDCSGNKYLQCKIRKWGDTEWVTPTREYMGMEE